MKVILALVLIGMLWFFYQQHHNSGTSSMKHVQVQEYMKKISIVEYNETGVPKQKISAYSWAFVPAEKQSKIVAPKINLYKPNGDVWEIEAKKAYATHPTIQAKIESIAMYDSVKITKQDAEQPTAASSMTTEELHYYPAEKKVTSEVLVTMQQPDLLITGVGMLGYLDNSWVQLFDRTTTIYNKHTIQSKEVTFDNQQGTALYKQNVTVDNDTSHLAADTLSVHRDSQKKIKTLIAHGKPATYTKNGDQISGPVLTYDVATETLHTKNSKVTIQNPKANVSTIDAKTSNQ